MKCLRCGYCCIQLDVIIVDPKYVDGELDFNNESILGKLIAKGSGKPCPHLEVNDSEYSCKLHDKPWYDILPCFEYGQIEKSELDLCRTGSYINGNEQMSNKLRSIIGWD